MQWLHILLLQELLKAEKGAGKVFLAELEFKESQALFHRLAANSLPWIVHLAPTLNIGNDGLLKIKHEDVVSQPLGLCDFLFDALQSYCLTL